MYTITGLRMARRYNLRAEDRRHWRRWLLLFIVIAVIIASAKTCASVTGRSNPIDIALTHVTTPVVGAIKSIGEGIASLRHIFRIPSLLRENSSLKAENEFLDRRNAELQFLEAENKRLEELLKIPAKPGYLPVTARVIARPYDLWMETVLINAGSSRGVRQGNLVVNANGVVGLIEETYSGYSRVRLISSPAFTLGAVTSGLELEGVVRGVSAGSLKLDMVPAGARIELGEKVFTRGEETLPGSNNNRPRGVYIGLIVNIGTDRSGFKQIDVQPAANVNQLGNVVVYTR